MKCTLALLGALFFTALTCWAQTPVVTEVFLPKYVQGAGTVNTADDRKTPYACRLTISGLTGNTTYRFYSRFVNDPANTGNGEGAFIYVKQTGDFVRQTSPSLLTSGARYGEFTTDASGSYTGWFMAEVSQSSIFAPGSVVYFRVVINNGTTTSSVFARPTAPSPITVVNFDAATAGGTGIRTTPATAGIAKNFVFLWDNESGTGQPIAGTVIEGDGVDNSVANGYADFYGAQVNGIDKTWGTIIPNNLSTGIRKIAQYSLADGAELGSKTSADGSWAKEGGGTASTVNTTGGLTAVIVLDGTVVSLGAAVKLPQTITFNTLAGKTYGDADFAPGATASSLLPVTYTSSNPAVATIVNGNTIHIVGAGSTDITAEQAGNNDYNAATAVVQPLTVGKAALTVTANDQQKVQGDPLPILTVSYSGFVNGDDETDLGIPATATTTADANSAAGTYPITPGGAASDHYQFTYINGTLTVTAAKQAQTITFNSLAAKTYGSADLDPAATTNSGLTISYTSSDPAVATILNNKIHITGAGTATITASQAGNAAWEPAAAVQQVLTVNKAALSIKADDKTRLVGQPNPAFTVTYTGFVNNETNAVLTAQPVIVTSADAGSPVGTYAITVSGAQAANYSIVHVNGMLTVSPLPAQTITFPALPAKKYGDVAFDPGATASSGLTVTYSSSNTQVAVIDNGLLKIVGAGTVTITASQAGNAFWAAAPDVERSLTVAKLPLVIRADNQTKTEGQANPALTYTATGFLSGDDINTLVTKPEIGTTATNTSLPGDYTIALSGAASDKYSIAQFNGTLTVLPAQGASQDNLNAYISAPGVLKVTLYAVSEGKAVIQLFDNYGTRLQQLNVGLAKGSNVFRLSVPNVLPGVYHVRATGAGFQLKTKLIIQ